MYKSPEGPQRISTTAVFKNVKPINATSVEQKEALLRKYRQRKRLKQVVNSIYYSIALIFFTIYVLFGDDIRHFVCDKDTDIIFYIITLITIVFFVCDIVFISLLYSRYVYSFLFWFDVISTVTLIFDLGWVITDFVDYGVIANYGTLARGARSALIAVKASRYIQIMRYIRLIRISNCFKFKSIYSKMMKAAKNEKMNAKKARTSYDIEVTEDEVAEELIEDKNIDMYNVFFPNVKNFLRENGEENKEAEKFDYMDDDQTNVQNSGIVLSIANTQRVIIIVLVLIMLIPVFSVDTYFNRYTAYISGLSYIGYTARNLDINDASFKILWDTYTNNYTTGDYKLQTLTMYKKVDGSEESSEVTGFKTMLTNQSESDIIESRRFYELLVINDPDDVDSLAAGIIYVTAVFDKKKVADFNAWLNLLRTIFCLVTFFIMALFFSRDANRLILEPMEEMMKTIKRIKANPIQAAKDEEEKRVLIEEKIKKNAWLRYLHHEQQKYETTILINTLVQSGKLLAIGLGEAGTEVVIRNLKQDKLNPLIRGNEVICLFGFCDIRGFTEANDILKEDVLCFVNEVAKIVHSIVDRFAGCTNKNLGNNFLVVWKFRESDIEDVIRYDDDGREKIGKQLKKYSSENNPVTARCELAITSFLTTISSIHQTKSLEKYHKTDNNGRGKLSSKVVMSFGLHIGWAFEGAIGSEHKIDVSYLSPNVNLASRLEAATKQYGTLFFVSGQVIDLVSQDVRSQHRLVDIVNVKGSKQAVKLYTFDLNTDSLEQNQIFEDQILELEKDQQKLLSIDYRNKLKEFHEKAFNGKFSTKSLLVNNKIIRRMRVKYTREFFKTWEAGIDCYVSGKWREARVYFEKTRDFFLNTYGIPNREDGPSINLISYMEEYDLKAPDYWKGVRKLLSK